MPVRCVQRNEIAEPLSLNFGRSKSKNHAGGIKTNEQG
jgi:hypothetical protein